MWLVITSCHDCRAAVLFVQLFFSSGILTSSKPISSKSVLILMFWNCFLKYCSWSSLTNTHKLRTATGINAISAAWSVTRIWVACCTLPRMASRTAWNAMTNTTPNHATLAEEKLQLMGRELSMMVYSGMHRRNASTALTASATYWVNSSWRLEIMCSVQ